MAMTPSLPLRHSLVDLRYWVWVLGVVLSNMVRHAPFHLYPVSPLIVHLSFLQAVIYHILYCGFSFMGLHWNYFYYSMHLFDLVVNVKLAKHAFGSLLHNVKQARSTWVFQQLLHFNPVTISSCT